MSNISNLNLRSSLEKTNKSICQKSPRTLLDMAGGPKKKILTVDPELPGHAILGLKMT